MGWMATIIITLLLMSCLFALRRRLRRQGGALARLRLRVRSVQVPSYFFLRPRGKRESHPSLPEERGGHSRIKSAAAGHRRASRGFATFVVPASILVSVIALAKLRTSERRVAELEAGEAQASSEWATKWRTSQDRIAGLEAQALEAQALHSQRGYLERLCREKLHAERGATADEKDQVHRPHGHLGRNRPDARPRDDDPVLGQLRLQYEYFNYLLDDLEDMRRSSMNRSEVIDEDSSSSPSLSAGGVPKNLILNFKDRSIFTSDEPHVRLLRQNVERIVALNPGWRVLFDDDAGCLEKTMATGYFHRVGRQRVERWYGRAPGRLRSDLCRLAQLQFYRGGVYVDNDFELVEPLDDIFGQQGYAETSFISVWSAPGVNIIGDSTTDGHVMFQAFMAASDGSRLVARGLELFRDHISGEQLVRHHDLGTALMARALNDVINDAVSGEGGWEKQPRPSSYLDGMDAAAARFGITMFREIPLTPQETVQMGRRDGGACHMAVKMLKRFEGDVSKGEEFVARVMGFSRTVTFGDPSVSCRETREPGNDDDDGAQRGAHIHTEAFGSARHRGGRAHGIV